MPEEAEDRGDDSRQFYKQKEEQQMELIEWTLQEEHVDRAIKSVKKNNGAPGVDGMTTDELDGYFALYREEVKEQIRKGRYSPSPVRRVYIPKANRKRDRSEFLRLLTELYSRQCLSTCRDRDLRQRFAENTESVQNPNCILKARLNRKELENIFLKKLDETERRRF